MNETTFIVKPLLPTVLGDLETHELRPNDLFLPITVRRARPSGYHSRTCTLR